ncbi:MAG: DUF2796 domain-containing protein [Rubrivivax sp.]
MARALILLLFAVPALAAAQPGAHVHGQAKLEVVIDGPLLAIALESPLDGLVGFEHPPRTAPQKQAAARALALLKEPPRLFTLPPEAGCRSEATEVVAPVLEGQASKDGHGDLDARWTFRCTAPEKLATLEQGLFAAFPRLSRLEVQVAGPKGQRKQSLKRPERAVRF